MNQQTYRKITDGIRRLENGEKIVQFINSIATKIVYMAYVVGIIILFDEKNKGLARFVAVTAISFILVSIVRRFINSERPYTMYDFKPIIEKNKRGESMPSRHVFSAFIIGMAFLYIGEIPLGIIVFVCGLIIAIVRVISGVHFPKDVIGRDSVRCSRILHILELREFKAGLKSHNKCLKWEFKYGSKIF